MIKPASDVWYEISKTNNLEFEFHTLGNNKNIPVLIARDVYQQPDKVRDFLLEFPYWATKEIEDAETTVRPGLTAEIPPLFQKNFYRTLTKPLQKMLGVKKMEVRDGYVNLEGGKMHLDRSSISCCYPHVDNKPDDPEYAQMHVAANINLSKSDDPVRTGFWSWFGKTNYMDLTLDEENELDNFYGRHEQQVVSKWFQMKNYENFRFEDAVEMGYNDLVLYSTMQFHNPYIESEWHGEQDRMMLTSFYAVYPDDLDFNDSELDIVSATWETFRLNTLHNYHPRYTRFI